jgi:co-chaperonin GroES (HSP10)
MGGNRVLLGYAGRILRIDLTTRKTQIEKLDQETAKKYVGGIGLGMRLWLNNSKAGVKPLDPENPLVLSVGPGDRDESGKRVPMDVSAGDTVLFAKYAGTEIKLDSKKLLILRESDLLAIVEG